MTGDVLLRELKMVVGDVFNEAKAGDGEAREWFLRAFPGHEEHFLHIWPDAKPPRPGRLSPRDFELLRRNAWNIESRLVIERLAGIVCNK